MNDGMNAQDKGINQAAIGMQQYLVITQVPAGAAGSLINRRLISAGPLVIAGDYYCRFYMGGVGSVTAHLKATFGGGETCSSDVYSTYKDGEGSVNSDATKYQGFTSDGAMTTATLQHPVLTATLGEQYGLVKLTITGTGGVEFTVAEVNGN
jgi:hypothetical protein